MKELLSTDTIAEIREITNGDKTLMEDLYETFVSDAGKLIESIKEELKGNNLEFLKRQTHTLKGLSGTIGAIRVYEITEIMHNNLHMDMQGELEKLYADLEESFDQTRKEIDRMLTQG